MKTARVRKELVDKLIEECTETVEEVKLAKKKLQLSMKRDIDVVLSHCTLCYFQWFLQLTLELVLILFIFIVT